MTIKPTFQLDEADLAKDLDSKIRRLHSVVSTIDTRRSSGRLLSVSGTLVRAELPGAEVGELCELRDPDTGNTRYAEVVGIEGDVTYLAPYGGLSGLSIRTEAMALGRAPSILCGDHLLGTVIDSFGNQITLEEPKPPKLGPEVERRALSAPPPHPLKRGRINTPLPMGIRAIDSLLTCGEGQRIGIFGNAGGGKSTLVSEIVARAQADVFVVALVGERGREVNDFLYKALTPQSRERTVIVVATSDRPSVERMQASLTATSVAEHFRDRGMKVLLIVDSVTRLARALREIGLSAGEPPGRRGFPPSVYSIFPQLFERAGPAPRGSITAFYTVLVEGDLMADPIAEETKSLLDGHIILSDKLAAANHYPAIDVLQSRSRLFDAVTSLEHRQAAGRIRELYSKYQDLELLIQVGEYKQGGDLLGDESVAKIDAIRTFLKQKPGEPAPFSETVQKMQHISNG